MIFINIVKIICRIKLNQIQIKCINRILSLYFQIFRNLILMNLISRTCLKNMLEVFELTYRKIFLTKYLWTNSGNYSRKKPKIINSKMGKSLTPSGTKESKINIKIKFITICNQLKEFRFLRNTLKKITITSSPNHKNLILTKFNKQNNKT